ncbi:MAG: CDGSH iron-sulfur domain-containing protein, partial [Chloroflexi bacterium]|nr:CDGSH iron-sulfur domain-containing protein [Chloroflexota bacterium]
GNRLEITDETWLCRCGESDDKPYCVGAHRGCEFADRSRVAK